MQEKVLSRFLSIPAHEKMTFSEQKYVIDSIKNFLTKINMSPNFKNLIIVNFAIQKNLIEVLNLADLPIGDKYMPEEKVDLAKEAYELKNYDVSGLQPLPKQRLCGSRFNLWFLSFKTSNN